MDNSGTQKSKIIKTLHIFSTAKATVSLSESIYSNIISNHCITGIIIHKITAYYENTFITRIFGFRMTFAGGMLTFHSRTFSTAHEYYCFK